MLDTTVLDKRVRDLPAQGHLRRQRSPTGKHPGEWRAVETLRQVLIVASHLEHLRNKKQKTKEWGEKVRRAMWGGS